MLSTCLGPRTMLSSFPIEAMYKSLLFPTRGCRVSSLRLELTVHLHLKQLLAPHSRWKQLCPYTEVPLVMSYIASLKWFAQWNTFRPYRGDLISRVQAGDVAWLLGTLCENMAMCAYDPSAGRQRQADSGSPPPIGLAKKASFRFSERYCLREHREEL